MPADDKPNCNHLPYMDNKRFHDKSEGKSELTSIMTPNLFTDFIIQAFCCELIIAIVNIKHAWFWRVWNIDYAAEVTNLRANYSITRSERNGAETAERVQMSRNKDFTTGDALATSGVRGSVSYQAIVTFYERLHGGILIKLMKRPAY